MIKFRKSIACLTFVALLSSGIAVPPAQADPSPPPAPAGDWKPQSKRGFWDRLFGRDDVPSQGKMRAGADWSPPGRSGAAQAMARPEPPGKRTKELTGKRTATRTVFRLDDGRVQTELSSVPVRYRDEGGRWRAIDTGVSRLSEEGFSYGNDGTGFATRFGDRSDRLVRVEFGGRGVTLGLAGPARRIPPKVSGSTVTYAGAWDGADLLYEVTPTGVKEAIVLKRAPAEDASFAFTVKSDGVTARTLPDGSVGFFAAGKNAGEDVPAFTIPKPFMTDARKGAASTPGQGLSDKVTMSVAGRGTTSTVTITPDPAWLSTPGRAYPVLVDPTISVQPDVSTSKDAMIVSYAATTNYGSDPRLGAGVDKWGKVRSLLQFDLAGVVPAGTPVDAASLSLYWDNTVLANTTSAPVALEARAVSGAWSPGTVTWNSINAALGDVAGTASFNPAQTNAWTSFPVTEMVRGWVGGTRPNNGFVVKAANEATSAGGPIYAAGEVPGAPAGEWPNASTGTAPKLTLTFGMPAVQLDVPRTVHATGAQLSWSAYKDPSSASEDDLVEYQVHRSEKAGFAASAATLVAPLAAGTTSYTDTTAAPDSALHYQVVVVRKDGKRSASHTVPVKTPPAGYADAYLPPVKDATITTCDYTQPHNTLGGRPGLGVGFVPGGYGNTRGLIKWDTSQLPKSARVVEATGRMWRTLYNGNAVYYAAHALTREFDPASATWLNAASGTPWTWQGGDAVSTPIQAFGLAPTANSVWVNVNLTSQVQDWQADQSSNHGILLRVVQEPAKSCPASGEGAMFVSSEGAEASVLPRLHVRYTDTTITYTASDTPTRMNAGETVTVPVTVTNTTAQTWPGASTKLGYGWKRPDGTNATTAGSVLLTALPSDLAPGQTVTVNASVRAPSVGSGNKAEAYTLAWDLTNTTTNTWMSTAAQLPQLDQQIRVEDPTSDQLGVEHFYSYSSVATGAGSAAMVNNYAGNGVWSYLPFSHPSRGPDTSVAMTYNSLDTSRSSMGFGWSLRAATVQRLGSRLAFSPPGQTWPSQVRLLDSDGTTSVFTLETHGLDVRDCQPSTCDYKHPRGLHLYLQRTGSADPTRTWVFTAPDRTQFFFDADGYQSAVVDKNRNTLSFVYEQRRSNNVPTKFLQRVVDAAGVTTLELDWWTKGENYTYITDTGAEASATNLTNPRIIDQLQSITAAGGRKITFTYTVQGLMAKMVDGAGNAQAKTFRFSYDMTQGNNNAKLVKVTDPRNHDTKFDYYYPQVGDDPQFHWRAKTVTDRLDGVTRFGYVDPDGPQEQTINTTVTDPETRPTRYLLDEFGRPTRITDAKLQTTSQEFDDDHNLVRLEEPPANPRDPDGGVSTWVYDTRTGFPTSFKTAQANLNGWNGTTYEYVTAPNMNGHVADMATKRSPEGRTWSYGHDAAGNLTSVTDPAGTATATPGDFTTRYEYDAFGQLIRTVDANGHATSYSGYTVTARPQTITNADGKASQFTYDERGNLLSATDPLRHSKFQDYDLFDRPLAGTEQKDATAVDLIVTPAPVYDANDNVTKSTMANGAAYTSAYDANDRVTSVLEPRDEGGPERKTSFTYDKVGNKLTVTAPNGNLTDAAGDYTTRYGYDEIYQLTGVTDPKGNTTGYRYNGAGDLTRVVDAHKNATPDPDDFTALIGYTLDHQVSTVFDAAGFDTKFGYDRDGLQTTLTDQNDSVSTTVYDPRGLVIETRVPHASGEARPTTQQFQYDQVGNQTKVISPRGVATDDDPTDFLTETRYDVLNRPAEVFYPFDRDASDPRYRERHSVVYHYDDASRLRKIELPPLDPQFNSNPAEAGRPITSTLEYFDNDWIKKSTDPFGVATSYEYNDLGQRTKRTITAADGAEQRFLQWAYQPDGKVKELSDDGGTSDPPEFTAFDYAYDATGNLTTLKDRTADAPIDQWNITYDQSNQIERVAESLDGVSKNLTIYGYDENGALLHRVHDRGTDEFTYNVRNLLATVRNISGETQHDTSFEYTPRGERRQVTKSNGNVATFEYFLDGLLKHSVEKNSRDTVLAEHTLEYQANLQISRDVSKLECAPPLGCRNPEVTRVYEYDPRDRVIRVDNAGVPQSNEFYTYDANSNIIVQDVDGANSAFFYDRNRLTQSGTLAGLDTKYEYDPSGRLLLVTNGEGDNKKITASYAYDAFDHVTATEQLGADNVTRSNHYTYDPMGRTSSNLTTTGGPSKKTVFNYLGMSGEVLDEETDGSLTQWFQYSPADERLGMTKLVEGAAQHSVYGYNSHGDVETLTDDSGTPRGTYGYSAYGSLVDVNSSGVDARDPSNPFKESYNPYWYNSKRFDKVGNTYDMDARGYQPDFHRFLTPETSGDPLADAGVGLSPASSNRYGFAGGNPIANPRYTPNTPFDWKKELARFGAALVVGTAITALAALCPETAGLTCVAAAWVAGGAAAGAASYGAGVAVDPNQSFNWADFGIETGIGAAAGLLTFGGGRLLGAESRLFNGRAGRTLQSASAEAPVAPARMVPSVRGPGGTRPPMVEVDRALPGWSQAERLAQAERRLPAFALFSRTKATESRAYVGALNTETGDIALASSGGLAPCDAFCAEGNALLALGGDPDKVIFTGAVWVRRGSDGLLTAVPKPVCHRCQFDYPDRSKNFLPGVTGEPGGLWGD